MLTISLNVPVTDNTPLEILAAEKLGAPRVDECVILKKSVDARKKEHIIYCYRLAVAVKEEHKYIRKDVSYFHMNDCSLAHMLKGKKIIAHPVVVGTGPAGLFAALALAYLGANPVILERGDTVDERQKKLDIFNATLTLDTESNVQFGEGGAGTFSDGKLNTGTHSDLIDTVLKEFVLSGAPEEITYLNKPHIGTDELCKTVKNMRRRIEELGGKFYFNTKLTDIKICDGKIVGAVTDKGVFPCDELYLAIGHSARDTFEMLYKKNVFMTSKTFSMGTRIEHLRSDVDRSQYGTQASFLPAADYKAAVRTEKGSVYTFCMCPGGKVINASSEEGGVCVNGMSYHARDGVNSNAALLFNVSEADWKSEHPLAGMEFQRSYERKTYEVSHGYLPVVQTVGDFLQGKAGTKPTAVTPSVGTGYVLGDLRACLPESVADGIKEGIPLLAQKLPFFGQKTAVLTGIEARSSSPVRILRDDGYESNVKGLYPIGEGAGYAGGIMSAAVDGLKAVLCGKKII